MQSEHHTHALLARTVTDAPGHWTELMMEVAPDYMPSREFLMSWPEVRIIRRDTRTTVTEHARWRNGVLVGRAAALIGSERDAADDTPPASDEGEA